MEKIKNLVKKYQTPVVVGTAVGLGVALYFSKPRYVTDVYLSDAGLIVEYSNMGSAIFDLKK